jgi:excisionase family DNA binding protein
MSIQPSLENPLYTVPQVAKIFGVEESTIRRWIREKTLHAIKVRGRWRVERDEVIRLVNQEHG